MILTKLEQLERLKAGSIAKLAPGEYSFSRSLVVTAKDIQIDLTGCKLKLENPILWKAHNSTVAGGEVTTPSRTYAFHNSSDNSVFTGMKFAGGGFIKSTGKNLSYINNHSHADFNFYALYMDEQSDGVTIKRVYDERGSKTESYFRASSEVKNINVEDVRLLGDSRSCNMRFHAVKGLKMRRVWLRDPTNPLMFNGPMAEGDGGQRHGMVLEGKVYRPMRVNEKDFYGYPYDKAMSIRKRYLAYTAEDFDFEQCVFEVTVRFTPTLLRGRIYNCMLIAGGWALGLDGEYPEPAFRIKGDQIRRIIDLLVENTMVLGKLGSRHDVTYKDIKQLVKKPTDAQIEQFLSSSTALGSISGVAYGDSDGSGSLSDNDALVADGKKILLLKGGNIVAETFTVKAGRFIFKDVPPGEYEIDRVFPAGFVAVNRVYATLGAGEHKTGVNIGSKKW